MKKKIVPVSILIESNGKTKRSMKYIEQLIHGRYTPEKLCEIRVKQTQAALASNNITNTNIYLIN